MTPLSAREMEVARLVAEDLTDKLIADILGISAHTVDEYLSRISKKLGIRGRRSRRRVIARWVEGREGVRPPHPDVDKKAS